MKEFRLLKASTFAAIVSGQAVFADGHATHPVTGETLAAEQSFTYWVGAETVSFDPGLAYDRDGLAIARDLFEGLMNQDATGNLIPGVATGFDVSDDGLTYTFTLRDTAKWSNGDPVTAHDFAYAWKRVAAPATESPNIAFLALMALQNADAVIAGDAPLDDLGVAAIDDLTLEVRLSAPLPYFPQMVTHPTTFPVHQATVEAFGADWTAPENIVSNGAYQLSELLPEERIVRVRNAQYWDAANTILDTVTAVVIPDDSVALTRYLAGELDQTQVPAGQFPRLSEEFPTQAVSVPSACSYYYTINLTDTGNPALQNPDVRQALSLALDREIIAENVLASGQTPAYSFTHWATANFVVPETNIAGMSQAERDVQAAALMADAGYGPDKPLEIDLVYNTSESHKSVAVAISQMWKQTLGVETVLTNLAWQDLLDVQGNQDFEISQAGWCADYNDASSFLDLMQTGSLYNASGYANPEVDALLEAAKTSSNPQQQYAAIEQIIAEDVPIIPIYHFARAFMQNDKLRGWPFANIEQQWYAKDLYKVAE